MNFESHNPKIQIFIKENLFKMPLTIYVGHIISASMPKFSWIHWGGDKTTDILQMKFTEIHCGVFGWQQAITSLNNDLAKWGIKPLSEFKNDPVHRCATMGWFIDAMWCINTLVNLASIGLDRHVHSILHFFVPPSLSKPAMTRS